MNITVKNRMAYKKYTVDQLLQGYFTDKPVEVRGIPRGTTANDEAIWGYLQYGGNFIQFNGKHMFPGMPEPTLSLLRASSESGLEVSIRGLYSTKTIQGHPGDLTLHTVDLQNVSCDFLR